MAVKVMVAPAIANAEIEKPARAAARGRDKAAAKPKRRRSSVFDADGNEVFITLVCLKCHKTRPLSQFGLRKMADGAIRNQPWCRTCRSASTEKPRKRSPEENEPMTVEASAPAHLEAAQEAPPSRPPASNVAAEVAAALAAGLRR